jgi:hypothetical protein
MSAERAVTRDGNIAPMEPISTRQGQHRHPSLLSYHCHDPVLKADHKPL